MKKLILLVLALVFVGLLGWYATSLMDKKGKSDTELIEFSVKDTNSVNKIIITDAFSNRIELMRNGNEWTDENGDCVTKANVHFILDAFANIEFKGYLPDNSIEQFTKLMSSQHTKVEIYQNDEWTKTWYIGPAAQDHYGQIMLLESEEQGKSGKPVMMKIKGMSGIIEPRFFADKRKWMCTNIFAVPIDRISSVEVKYFDDPVLSFSVTKKGMNMNVYQQGRKLKNVDTAMIYRYLHKFKKVHFELANFELSEKQLDSLKRSMPFATLTLKETSGKASKLRMFRIKGQNDFQVNEFGDVVNIDMNKFWCELPNGEVVKCQYFVFNPLILGHVYFPMDLSKRKAAGPQLNSNVSK
jgi:hypothetical protein